MTKFSDEQRKAIMREARANLDWCKQIERDAAERRQRAGWAPPDPMVVYRQDADAAQAAERAETRRRVAAAARDQREREDRRIAIEAAVAAEVDNRIATAIAQTLDTVTEAICPVLEKFGNKLGELERLLKHLQSLSEAERAQPIDMPPLRSLRRDVN